MQSLYKPQNARERALKSPPSWIDIPEFLHVARVARDLADNLAGGIFYSRSGLNKLEHTYKTAPHLDKCARLAKTVPQLETWATREKMRHSW